MEYTLKKITEEHPEIEVTLIDLANYDIQFSDGRSYTEYEGDTKLVTEGIMEADAIIWYSNFSSIYSGNIEKYF